MFSVVAVICVFFVFLVFCIIDTITVPNYPRGPTRYPLVGSYLAIRKLRNEMGFFHLVWEYLEKIYGSVFSVKLGRIEAVVVSGYDAVRQVLCNDEFDGRPDGFFFRFRAFYQRLGMVFVDGPEWKEQKMFFMRHLRKLGFGGNLMEALVAEEVDDLILDIKRKCENGKPIEVCGLFDVSVLNGLWSMLAGHRFSLNDAKLQKLMDLVHVSFRMIDMSGGVLNQMPFIRFLAPKSSGYTDISHILNEFYAFLKDTVDEHRNLVDGHEDFICEFLKQIEKNKDLPKSTYTEKQLLVLLLDLFLAGSETTSSSLSFVILHLLKHQDVQAKVREELDSVVGDREVQLADKRRLTYLQAVIMEVHRYSNVAPLAIAHRTTRKTTINEYILPKDTLILASIWSVHMDKMHWGDPQVFRPERFIDSSGQIIKDSWFMPFGVGTRRCLGEVLAKANIFLFTAKLVQKFEMQIPHGAQLPERHQEGITISPSQFSAIFMPRRY